MASKWMKRTMLDRTGDVGAPCGSTSIPELSGTVHIRHIILITSLLCSLSPSSRCPFWQSRIYNIIAEYGLKVNEKKTKTFVPGTRREVTGSAYNIDYFIALQSITKLPMEGPTYHKFGYARKEILQNISRMWPSVTEKSYLMCWILLRRL